MNEGENSSMPQSPNFSSPNISSGGNQPQISNSPEPVQPAITSSDVAAMSGTNAGTVAAAAAAMPESDTPVAINSGAISTPAPNTTARQSRFNFGANRFRGSSGQQQTSQFFANTPDYFDQAVSDVQLPNDYSTDNKKKKIRIFAVCAGAVAVVAAIVIAVVLSSPTSLNAGDDLAKLQEINAEYRENVEFYESLVMEVRAGGFALAPFSVTSEANHNKAKNIRDTNMAKIKEYREKLNSFSGLKLQDKERGKNVNEYITNLKKILDSHIKVYEEYSKIFTALSLVYLKQADDESIKGLEAASSRGEIKEIASKLKDYYSKRQAYGKSDIANDCNNYPKKPVCISNGTKFAALDQSITEDTTLDTLLKDVASGIGTSENDNPLTMITYIDGVKNEK